MLLGGLVTLAAFSNDMGLPVLGPMGRELGVPTASVALTLSVFMAGFASGPLLFGPLSDRYGRRPILLLGLTVFAAFGTLGAFAHSLSVVLVWRFFMGAGAGASQVMAIAMVRDLFEGHEARAKQSYVNLVGGVAPIIAPSVGVWVALFGGWRAIYGVLAAGGVVLLGASLLKLSESSRYHGGTLTLRGTLANYGRVLRHRVTMGYAVVLALSFGSLFAYVAGSSLILIDLLGVSRRAYGILFASTSFGLMVGSFTNARLIRRHVSHTLLLVAGMTTLATTALLLVILTLTGTLRVPLLIALILLGNVGQGVFRPNAILGALEPLPEIAGVASAVLMSLQYLVAALSAAMVAALFDGRSAIAITGAMAAFSLTSFAIFLLVVRPAERRRGSEHVDGSVLAA